MKKYFISLATLSLALIMGVSSVSAHTPPGLAKKGGLPPGIQKKFIKQEKDIKEYQTAIKDIDVKENRIVIEDGTAMLSLLVSNKAKVQLNNKTAKLEDLRKKDEVYIKLDKDNTIIEIKATREKEVKSTVEGNFLLVNEDDDKIYIYEDKKLSSYPLDSHVLVKISGEKSRINRLTQGMKVKLTIEDGKVTLIEVTKEVEEETTKLDGKILAKYDGKDPLIIIKINNDIKVFYVEDHVDLSKVKTDKDAVIYIIDNRVTQIRMK